jgi:hypothetical protein
MSKKPNGKAADGAAGAVGIEDLARRMKRDRGGAPVTAQLKVLQWLLTLAGDGGEVELPGLTALGVEVGLSRQAVANALTRLRQRQLIDERVMTIPVVKKHRKVRLVVPHMPDELRQLALPFEGQAA